MASSTLDGIDAGIPTARLVWDRTRAALVPEADTTETAPYLSGVVPLDWLARAHGLGGQCLAVGVLLWRMRHATKRETVWLARSERARFGISDRAYWEALRRMEAAGLVAVERQAGRALRVTVRADNPRG